MKAAALPESPGSARGHLRAAAPWVILWAVGLLSTRYFFPARLEGHMAFFTPCAIAVGVLVIRWLWLSPPAITLSLAIALSIFSGSWSQLGIPGLPLNRLLVALALAQVLLRAPGSASLPPIRFRSIHFLMLVAIIYVIASAAVSATLTSTDGIFELVDVFGIAPFLAFLIAPAVFAGERERRLLLTVLTVLGVYLGFTAIFEILGPHSLVFPAYITQSDVLRPGVLRAGGPFQSPVANGFGLFSCAVAALMRSRSVERPWLRAATLGAGAVAMFGCFLTLERGVWIAAATATIAAASMSREGRRWLVPGIVLGTVVIGGALLASSALSQKTSERVAAQQSVWDRQNQTSTGLRMISAKPLLGFGWDRYEADSLEYFHQPADYPMTGYTTVTTIGLPAPVLPLHDTYLAYGAEIGFVGLGLWFLCWAGAAAAAVLTPGDPRLRSWKTGLLALAVFFLIIGLFDPHEQPFPMMLLLTWSGIAYGTGRVTRSTVAAPLREHRLTPVGV